MSPTAKTTIGVLLEIPPVVKLPKDCDSETLGETILGAIGHGGQTVEHPADWRAFIPPTVTAAGATTWKGFIRPMPGLVSLTDGVNDCQVELHSFDGRGFEPTSPRTEKCIAKPVAPRQIGEEVRRLFTLPQAEQGGGGTSASLRASP